MRHKIFSFSNLLFAFLLLCFSSCSKTAKKSETFVLEQKVDFSKYQNQLRTAPDLCQQSGHGMQVGGSVSWSIATCKSDCERGIGFRCGRTGMIKCADGTYIPLQNFGSSCPVATITNRNMIADYEFYSNGTLKLIFKNSLPSSEIGNTNFEIEANEMIELPDFLSIGGIIYRGYYVYTGNYTINMNDGQFGSVTIPISLIQ